MQSSRLAFSSLQTQQGCRRVRSADLHLSERPVWKEIRSEIGEAGDRTFTLAEASPAGFSSEARLEGGAGAGNEYW